MISTVKAQQPGRTAYCTQLQARLILHRKLDLMILAAVRRYLGSHVGESRYWGQHCRPLMLLLREHYRLTQLTSRPLSHYREHVRKMVLRIPHQRPTTGRARTFLALIETWYWREYS